VTDDRVLGVGGNQFEHGQPEADRDPDRRLQDHPDLMVGATPPLLAGAVEVPAAVHPEMAVDGGTTGQAHQEVLASCNHRLHRSATEVGGRQGRHPEVGTGQLMAGQRLMQSLGRSPDGVALRHRSSPGGPARVGDGRSAAAGMVVAKAVVAARQRRQRRVGD
jgi:hypothetical protein